MNVKINEDLCIGCGACHEICSDVFDMSDEGLAIVKNNINPLNFEEDVLDAIESCPTNAISNNNQE